MQKALVGLMRGRRARLLLAGPLGGISVVALLAWFLVAVPSQTPVQAGPLPASGLSCADGNALDGDCCSAAGVQEESRFGFVPDSPGYVSSRATACTISGANHCEDGLDNDGDGLIDAEDPECATLNETLRHVLLGNDPGARNSVRTGSSTVVRHQNADGTAVDPSEFWMPGFCDGGTCGCPDTLTGYDPNSPGNTHSTSADQVSPNDPNFPSLPRPACQMQGESCSTDRDCEPSQYPGAASHAGVCGYNIQLKREGVFEGNVVTRANSRLGRAFIFARSLGDIGGQFFCDGCVLNPTRNVKRAPQPNLILDGEPWWVGPGLCLPSGTESCVRDEDCATAGDLCEARLQLDFNDPNDPNGPFHNPNMIITGGTLDPNDPLSLANDYDRCVQAMASLDRFGDPNDPGRLTSDNLTGASLGEIKIPGTRSQVLDFTGANQTFVRNIDQLTMGRNSQLQINAHSTSTVVLRVLDRFRVGAQNTIALGPDPSDPNDPGIAPDRVLWLFDGARGKISTTQGSTSVGTMLAPQRPRGIVIGSDNIYTGALMAPSVDVGGFSEVNHRPFIGMLPTNLSVEKTVIPDPSNPNQGLVGPNAVAAGEDLIYTVTVTNNGPSFAPGVVLTDLLPADGSGDDLVSFNSVNIIQGNGSCEHHVLAGEADRIVCYFGTLNREDDPDTAVIDNSATIEVRVTANPNTRGNITNTASAAANIEEGNPADNTASADIVVLGISDLVVTKSDDVDPAIAGQASGLTYTITVDNLGPSDAFDALPTGVVLSDPVPANLTIISATWTPGDGGAPQACSVSGNDVTCPMGRIDVADAAEQVVIVTTPDCDAHLTNPPASPISNTATVSNLGGELDPDNNNNFETQTTGFMGEVDLTSAKIDDPDPASAGLEVEYTVTITNAGPSDASQVTFQDTLPAGMALDTAQSPLCQVTGGTAFVDQVIECSVGSVQCPTDGGNTTAISFIADIASNVLDGAVLTNSVDSSDQFETDTNEANDGTTEDTTVYRVQGLAIGKTITGATDPNDPCVPGENIEYTMVVQNFGPSDTTDAPVTDDFDSNLTCTWTCTATGSASCDDANGSGDINTTVDIVADQTGTANFVTIVADCFIDEAMRGVLSNTADVAVPPGSILPDPFPGDNTSNVECTLDPRSDLSVVKAVTGTAPHVAGEANDVQYQITVTNLGPSDAIDGGGVVLTDVLPAGAQFVSITPAQGSCDAAPSGGSIDCALGSIADGDAVTIDVVMTADCDTRGIITNTASAVTGGERDPNTPNTTDVDMTIVGEVDLNSSKADSVSVTPGYVIAGETMTYTVTVNNPGPSDANNLTFTDQLPAGVTFVSGTDCTDAGGGQVTCDIPQITCGNSAQRTFTVAVASSVAEGATLTNNVTGITQDETERNDADDVSTLNTAARRETDLVVSKIRTAPGGNCVPGESVNYTIIASNNGPSDATGATVTDTFDSNLTCNWTCAATGSASCTGAGSGSISDSVNIAAGGGNFVTYSVSCTIDPGMRGTLTNSASATIEAGTLTDPVVPNSSSTNNCTLVPRANLTMTKVVTGSSPATPGLASDLVYTITVTNNGPSDAIDGDVTVNDTLPLSLASLVSIVPSQGSCAGAGNPRSCTLGDIDAGNAATVVVTMTANCDVRSGLSNFATVTTGPGGEADPGTPNNTIVAGPSLTPSVSLGLTTTASTEAPGFVKNGDPLTYTFEVSNNGPSEAFAGLLTISFDSDFTPSGNPAGCTGSGSTRTCNLGAIDCANDGSDATIVYNGTVTGSAIFGSTSEIVTTATVTSTEDGVGATDNATTDLRIAQGSTCFGGTDPDCVTGECVTDANGTQAVCCNTNCGSLCESCLGSENGGTTGTCGFINSDTDPSNECAADAPGGCGFDGFCGGTNDAGSGVDRRGQCGFISTGAQCTDTAPPGSTNQALNCLDALCNGSGTCNQNAANESNGTVCNDNVVNTNPDTCQTGTCVGQVHVSGILPEDFIFVSKAAGVDSGSCGSRTSPCNTINQGITRAGSIGATDVCVDGGTYNESVSLASGINIRGGFLRTADWAANSATSVITAATSTHAVIGNGVSNVLLRGFVITGASASGANNSSYGVRLISSSNITLQENIISGGNATTAGTGTGNGANGANAGGGGNGGGANPDGDGGPNGGGGGSSGCSRAGGAGGDGGYNTSNGGGGAGGENGGGSGGGGGAWGDPGQRGGDGNPGPVTGSDFGQAAGGSGGSVSGNLWVSNGGASGTSGSHGTGGGGGGGGGGQGGSTFLIAGKGGGGGGGGGGGCGGTASAGAGGGGGSFGVFLVSSTNINFTGNTITSGSGAAGGAAGTAGTGGSAGGNGSGGGANEAGGGGNGGVGRRGGNAGRGGGGAGGPSLPIFCSGTNIAGDSTCVAGSAGAGGAPNGGAGTSSATAVGCTGALAGSC
jgi:uncharacterized repeat protein (TIGR01451 family)